MTTARPHPTRERILELIDADIATGILRWRVSNRAMVAGAEVGSLNKDGYRRTTIDGCHAMVHVIVWFLATGDWLPGKIDHRDRVRTHNALDNLRPATQSEQRANSGIARNSTTGATGVVRVKKGQHPFWAHIMVRGQRFDLGYFDTVEAAAAARRQAAERHFGEFAVAEAGR